MTTEGPFGRQYIVAFRTRVGKGSWKMLALHVVPNICDGFVLEGLAECADTHRAVAANKLVKILQADKCLVGREACKNSSV